MWSPSFRGASRSLWRSRRPRTGVLGPRTAAMTFALLKVLALRKPLSGVLARARWRPQKGLAFATLSGATLGLLKSGLERQRRRARRWGPRASKALREPVEAALAVAMLGALALPLMVEAPKPAAAPHPGGTPPCKGAAERSADDDGDDGDDLDLNGAIASW
jgi:hypothetical protein